MEDKIFSVSDQGFDSLALEIFHFQYSNNKIYHNWVKTLGIDPAGVQTISQIPFLPIEFFKSYDVVSSTFEPAAVFESSGTTSNTPSRHLVKSLEIYEKSFLKGFEQFYGRPDQYVILGLLPSYLERKNSSLIVMVDDLIKRSRNAASGFYLREHGKLEEVLLQQTSLQQPIILVGVTYALLDFAENRSLALSNTVVMETGGMKGRRKEMTRKEVHDILKDQLGVAQVHSEFGMTELLSQAYSAADGMFRTPAWMKILLRDEDDPLSIKKPSSSEPVRGVINIIDLANLYSCSFIATDDLGSLSPKGFTVDGRLDRSEVRGCSLLTL